MSDLKKCHKSENGNFLTAEGRLSYCFLLKPNPKALSKSGEPKYTTSILFPPDTDLTVLKEAVASVIADQFPQVEKRPKNLKSPFLRAEDKMNDDNDWTGWSMLRVSSGRPPGVVDASKARITDASEAYSGRWARLSVRPSYYDTDGNKGVTIYLQNAQLLRHDDPLGGGAAKAEEEFTAIAPSTSDDLFE